MHIYININLKWEFISIINNFKYILFFKILIIYTCFIDKEVTITTAEINMKKIYSLRLETTGFHDSQIK